MTWEIVALIAVLELGAIACAYFWRKAVTDARINQDFSDRLNILEAQQANSKRLAEETHKMLSESRLAQGLRVHR